MTILRALSRGLFIATSAALAFACNSDNSSMKMDSGAQSGEFKNFCELPSKCQEIAQACMPKDYGAKGTVHDCHILGHEVGTLDACSAKYDECIKACNAAPALSDGPVEDLYVPCRDAGAKKQ